MRRRKRSGMTLIEVMIAMMLLMICVTSLAYSVAKLAFATRSMQSRNIAGELVADRLETVKGAATYASIDSLYGVTESTIAGQPGFQRKTIVLRVGGGPASFDDYKIVTVVVTSPQLTSPSTKTTIIAAY